MATFRVNDDTLTQKVEDLLACYVTAQAFYKASRSIEQPEEPPKPDRTLLGAMAGRALELYQRKGGTQDVCGWSQETTDSFAVVLVEVRDTLRRWARGLARKEARVLSALVSDEFGAGL